MQVGFKAAFDVFPNNKHPIPLAIERQRATLLDFAAAMDQERTDAGVIYAFAGSLACRPLSPAPGPIL